MPQIALAPQSPSRPRHIAALALATVMIALLGACRGGNAAGTPDGAAKRFMAALPRPSGSAYLETIDPDLRAAGADSATRILRAVPPVADAVAEQRRIEIRGLTTTREKEDGDEATVRVRGTLRDLSDGRDMPFDGLLALRRVDGRWYATERLPGVQFPSNGNVHVADVRQPHGAYFSNPPSSGWHTPPLARPGVYAQPLAPEEVPHFLEHGGVWLLYTCPAACPDVAGALARIAEDAFGRQQPVAVGAYPGAGVQPPGKAVNAVAWGYVLALDTPDETQLRDFIEAHACRYNPEGGPYCTGVGGAQEAERDAGPAGFNPRR